MKKILAFSLAICGAIAVFAQTSVEGIYYNIDGKTATVTYKNGNPYSGDLVIPDKFTASNTEYTVTTIGTQALGFSGITSVSLPNTITEIESDAFNGATSLTELTIPASVTTLGNFILNNSAVVKLTMLATTPPSTASKTFMNFGTSNVTLFVPEGCAGNYTSAPWNTFKEIVELKDESGEGGEGGQEGGEGGEEGGEGGEEGGEQGGTETAICSFSAQTANISVVNKTIYVKNAESVEIYDILGNKIASQSGYTVGHKGIYFVVADGISYKIFIQ